jgi:hypothetical protein
VKIASVVTPPRAKVRRIEDLALSHRETRGMKLSGSRFSRATPVVVRTIVSEPPELLPEELAHNVYNRDGLGPYSETRGRLFA